MSDLDVDELRATRILNGVDWEEDKEIQVGDYIRDSITGEIGKVIEVTPNYYRKDDGFKIWRNSFRQIKHSQNLIDLVECGDYVNGRRIDKIINITRNGVFGRILLLDRPVPNSAVVIDSRKEYYCDDDIKTVVTHQQFNSVMYKVKE